MFVEVGRSGGGGVGCVCVCWCLLVIQKLCVGVKENSVKKKHVWACVSKSGHVSVSISVCTMCVCVCVCV